MVSFIAVVTFILSHMLFNKCRGMSVCEVYSKTVASSFSGLSCERRRLSLTANRSVWISIQDRLHEMHKAAKRLQRGRQMSYVLRTEIIKNQR